MATKNSGTMFEVTTEEMVACVERELKMRRQVYPRWVEQKKLTQRTADEELRRMEAVRDALPVVGAARELLEAILAARLLDWNMGTNELRICFVEAEQVRRLREAYFAARRVIGRAAVHVEDAPRAAQ